MHTVCRPVILVLCILFAPALILAACGGNQSAPPTGQMTQTTPATVSSPPTPADNTPATGQPTAASVALTIPCTELVPPDELERMVGVKPDNLLETVRPGWTACMWFYTPSGAAQQAEFTVQAYTGEETLVKWRMDTAGRPAEVVVNSLADYVQEGYTWIIPENKLRAVQALQDGRYIFLRFPSDNLALGTESNIADYLNILFRRLKEKGA